MSLNPRNRGKSGERNPGLKKSSDLFFSATNKSDIERLDVVKDRLLTMFIGLETQEPVSPDTRAQALRIQEEISLLVWLVEDWQTLIASRN
jgi:hypothetical protein